jgi:hypothetical protein
MGIIDYDILLRLLTAHLLGDFFLQFNKWVDDKNKKKIKSLYLYFHCILHGLLAYLLLFDFSNFLFPIIIMITHLFIDILKIYFLKDERFGFFADQIFHLLIIVFLWIIISNQFNQFYNLISNIFNKKKFWLIVSSYLFIFKPASMIISGFVRKWDKEKINKNSLKDAGKWIGYLERFLTLTFILFGQFEAVGFLLAAKSVFRFGDLKEQKEIKFTEYVLLGTLSSFTIVIFIGILVKKMLVIY